MNEEAEQFIGYLKYFGPAVEAGRIDVEKIGNSLIALNKLYKKYSRQKSGNISLKLGGIKKNCTEIQIFLEQIVPIAQPVAEATTWMVAAKGVGITEFGKQFFGTLGQQLALKVFAQGEKLKMKKLYFENNEPYVMVVNHKEEEKGFPKTIYDNQREYSAPMRDFVQLEDGYEDRMEIGYYSGRSQKKLVEINTEQLKYFESEKEIAFEDRLEEKFDESLAGEVRLVGKFVDYYGMAHEYHFSFQARKEQEEVGKQKILCKVDKTKITEFIDLLKPENQERNIYICGLATKSSDGKVDKIKIEWVSFDQNYNPHQKKMIW